MAAAAGNCQDEAILVQISFWILTVLLEFDMNVGGVDLAVWQDAQRCTVQVMVGTREAERCLPPEKTVEALDAGAICVLMM